jgi:hypothetical protein
MGLMDKIKAGAEQAKDLAGQAAAKAKDEAKELQLKREIGREEGELGRKALVLLESGAIAHPDLDENVRQIQALKAELASLEEDDGEPEGTDESGAASEEHAAQSNVPPAMPS